MSIRLNDDEIAALLAESHTGVLTTLRRDGWPVSLPVWFVVVDGAVHLQTPATTRKVARIGRDDRVSFLVERGRAWVNLTAVVITGRASVVADQPTRDRVAEAFASKYAAFHPDTARLGDATKRHYGSGPVVIRIDPVEPPITWDNAKVRLRD